MPKRLGAVTVLNSALAVRDKGAGPMAGRSEGGYDLDYERDLLN